MRLSFLKLKGTHEDCPEFSPDYIVVMCGIYDLVSVIKDIEGKRFKLLYPDKNEFEQVLRLNKRSIVYGLKSKLFELFLTQLIWKPL